MAMIILQSDIFDIYGNCYINDLSG